MVASLESLLVHQASTTSHFETIDENICVSKLRGISLQEYIQVLPVYCRRHHNCCVKCQGLLRVASSVLEKGFVPLSSAFKDAFPGLCYQTHSAKQKLLQIPLVSLRIGQPNSGLAQVYLVEYSPCVDYKQLLNVISVFQHRHHQMSMQMLSMTKSDLRDLLKLAQSDRERELISYTASKAAGLSATASRKHFGLEGMKVRAERVEEAIEQAKAIRESVDKLCAVREKAYLTSLGIPADSESNSSDEDTEGPSSESYSVDNVLEPGIPDKATLLTLIQESQWNWFQLVEVLEEKGVIVNNLSMDSVFRHIYPALEEAQQSLVELSYRAFCCDMEVEQPQRDREAAAFNADVVSDSDTDDPDEYLRMSHPHSEEAKVLIAKKVLAIRRKSQRQKAKAIAERNFLGRMTSKRVRGIVRDFPNIGNDIEEFVKECSVGADAWRRTGILTFDGNKHVKAKATYGRIQKHLEDLYQRKFSYGTVVQLCVARNKRRSSAARYKGVARVVSRRARKGFSLKYNPDTHWSAALYKGLNFIQYADGREIVNINRDDAAGFRLDTLATHRLHRTLMVKGHEVLATHTDFVNNYPSILHTTSYNFTKTDNTKEICVGVVKGAGVYPKNPAQHAADIAMLEDQDAIRPALINPTTGQAKLLLCVRVDGSTDEGPSHLEVQFWWTMHHFQKPTLGTLVTARNSGSSYLNHVELQNGCLSLAHSNLFIPSNLSGSCFNPQTGKLDQARLKVNMDLATDIYISRVNGAPCAKTVLHLFKGADSTSNQEIREHLSIYLKGTVEKRKQLKANFPSVFKLLETVWSIRDRHMVPDLPAQYVFYLKCCCQQECSHPLCQRSLSVHSWFPEGPPLSYLPFPIPDPDRPWGGVCHQCKGKCYGHFLSPDKALSTKTPLPMKKPPSFRLKEAYDKLKTQPNASDINDIAKEVLLPPDEVKIWFDHLEEVARNRKRGAIKAAITRQQKKSGLYYCGVCQLPYKDITDEVEDWIECDSCSKWFHYQCVGITSQDVPEQFLCTTCR